MSSSNLALIDSPVLVLDDIEDFTRNVAFDAANGFEFGQAFCDTTRHILLGMLVTSQTADCYDVKRTIGCSVTTPV